MNWPRRTTARHQPAAEGAQPETAARSEILLVGNPNVGKSVLFKNLTGRYVTVSNYPGTTVDVVQAPTRLGDADCNGAVSLADVNIISANWGALVATWDMGDFVQDGAITLADVNAISANWAQSYTPEPTTMLLLGLGGIAALLRRRRR